MTYLAWTRESKGSCFQPDNVEIRFIKALLKILNDPVEFSEVDNSKKNTFWQK